MTIMEFVCGLFIAIACTSLAISYAEIGASVRRALEIRLRGRAWLLTQLLAIVWPVTLPLLAARDLIRQDRSRPVLIGERAYRSEVLAGEGATQLRGEAEVQRAHDEWQARVDHFYALGAEAEKAKDWVAGQHVAANLDFLLETEPPRPVKTPLPQATKEPDQGISPIPPVEQRSEKWVGYCNVCVDYRESDRFRRYQVTGICDDCYHATHEGAM